MLFFFLFFFHASTIVRKGKRSRDPVAIPNGIDHSVDIPGVRIKTDMCFRDDGEKQRKKRKNGH